MQVKFLAILYRTFLFPLHLLTPVSPMYPGPPSTKNEGLRPKKRKTSSNSIGPRRHFYPIPTFCDVFVLRQEEQGVKEKVLRRNPHAGAAGRRRPTEQLCRVASPAPACASTSARVDSSISGPEGPLYTPQSLALSHSYLVKYTVQPTPV